MNNTIYGLSNEDYHFKEPYREYLSSSALKHYLKSPKAAKFAIDNPAEEKSDALRFGTLFHDLMVNCTDAFDNIPEAITQWINDIAVFEPPINEKTGQPYGNTTKTYKNACEAFLMANEGKMIATRDELSQIREMGMSLLSNGGDTSRQMCKLLRWGRPEVSFFYETDDGIKLKVRPDLLTRRKIIDFKTTTSDDLREDAINNTILKYGYQISASLYQYVLHKITGRLYDFILVMISKEPPYDCVMVDMARYGYRYDSEYDMVVPGPGAIEFKKLLDLHVKCTRENEWPGAETFIPSDNGVRIMEIQPPYWYENKFIEQ